jgi:hypothetical protein
MEQFGRIFIHYSEYHVIVCKQCQSAIIPANLQTHLNKNHAELRPKVRKEIVKVAEQIPGLARVKKDIVYPPASSAPVPHLPVWTNGFKCMSKTQNGIQCGHIQRGTRRMKTHNQTVHGWINRRSGGRPRKDDEHYEVPWISNIHCQQFFKTGGFQRLFQVEAEQEEEHIHVNIAAEQLIVKQAQQDFQSSWMAVEERKKKEAVDGEASRYEPNAWLGRTGWAKHLAGIEREWLMKLTWLPQKKNKEERELFQACRAVERLIFKAQKVSQASVIGWPAINHINRREFGGDSNEKPFYSQQMAKIMIKYTDL